MSELPFEIRADGIWFDGQFHTPEQPKPPMAEDLMIDLEAALQNALDICTCPKTCAEIEKAAAVAKMKLFKNEQNEESQAS